MNRQSRVTHGRWSVLFTTGSQIAGVILSVERHYHDRPNKFGGRGVFYGGDGDGRVFPSKEAAEAFAAERGYTEAYVRRTWCTACRCLHTDRRGRPTHWCEASGGFVR